VRWRQQLPVHSPVRALSLLRAAGAALVRAGDSDRATVAAMLKSRYAARDVVLTDSGTSALVMALRLTVGEGGTVAFPGYSCIDLAAAAIRAGVRVRLYDLDPDTLSPDLASVERVIARGVNAVLVAHLYGFPADIAGVAKLAQQARSEVHIIEDAAQGSGGTLAGRRLGSFGPLSILSFTAIAAVTRPGVAAIANPGPHGLSEMLYAFSSMTGNNGSAFAGLGTTAVGTPSFTLYNWTGAFAMLIGRFAFLIPVLALSGSLAGKKVVPASLGTFPTATPLFAGLVDGVIIIVGALTFFPALALGPIAEQLLLHVGKLF